MKFIAATALAVLFACPAFAQANCASNEDVVSLLTQKFGEEMISYGVDNKGQLVIWWGNVETGSWTATVTVGEETCIVAQGNGFQRATLTPNV